MNKIEVKILNPEAIPQAEKMMVCAARLTQRGHEIKSMADFMELYEKYKYEVSDGPWLDADEQLQRYTDWRDPTQWPTCARWLWRYILI